MNCGTLVCVCMFLVGQVSGLVENVNIWISDTINVITLHDGTTQGALPFHYTFSDLDLISKSQQCQAILTESFVFLSN